MSGSYVIVSSQQVILACEAYLADRQAFIQAKRELLIEREMSPRSGWLSRLFSKPAKDREEAIGRLRDSGDCMVSEWQAPAITGGLWASKVEDLLTTAKRFPDDSIHVTTQMVVLLDDFWE